MNEETLFAAALEKKTPADRQAFLEEACADNAELRAQVEELLRADSDAGSFLAHPPAGIDATTGTSVDGHETADCGSATAALPVLEACDKPDRIGKLVGKVGEYEIIEIVGQGGMGTVLRAFDTKLSRVVAVKVMAPELAANPTAVKRFLREATTAAAVVHDHVVTIHAVDDSHRPPFLVMEYIDGQTLQQKIDREGALQLNTILRIGSQAAAGLAAAHNTGLIHRDVKPGNILLENGVERVKITDFGLARAADDLEMTKAGMIAGTPQYMSPEQAKGESIDARSDLFSLGSVLYSMCTGRPAFRAETTMGVLKRVCEDQPRPIHEVNPEMPPWLDAIVSKLLAKSPADRFQSAAEVAELLSRHLAHVQQPAVHAQPVPITRPRVAGGERSSTPAFRRRWSIAAAAVLLLCAGLALAETTGVTHVAASVIRIVRGDGTLVVEIDDPNIQVLLDGEEVVITGAGPKELRLRPGQHELQTVKPGKPSDTKLITITRDGRQVVKVAREEPATIASPNPITRLVWADAADTSGEVSPDGGYLAFVDWDTGDLAVRDLPTGKNRRLTNKGSWLESIEFAMSPKFSADGTQLAYTWFNKEKKIDLRVIRAEGGDPRVVYPNKDGGLSPETYGWTPDGKAILATLRPEGESRNSGDPAPLEQRSIQLALIATADGSVRAIKTFEWRRGSRGNIRGFSLAPDGRTIAYSRIVEPASANHDIFLTDVETGQETRVTTHAADKGILAWTPDGQRLVYDMERQGSRDAWIIRIAGGKPQGEAELVKKDLGVIVPQGFTRDGTFYYGSSSQGPSLFIATLDLEKATATATPLAAEKFNITDQLRLGDWSPDGEYLAYLANMRRTLGGVSNSQEIRIVSMKTGQTRVLKPDVKYPIWRRFPWSPDGRSFIAATLGIPSIYQIDAVSGQATTVVEARGSGQPVWSRDGRGIFYYKRPNLFGQTIPNIFARTIPIVLRDLKAGTEKEVLTPGDPDFDGKLDFWFEPSPDGRQLALLGEPNGESMALWLIPVDGGASRELLHVKRGFAGSVGWTPDGRFVLFTRLGGDETQRGLWYISASGGEPRKFALSGVEANNVTRIAIHPDGKQLAIDARGTGKSEVYALENFLPPLKDSTPAAAADESGAKSQ